MKKNTKTYEQAMCELEEIISQIESNELNIDQLSDKLKEAQVLITFCKEKLYKADKEIQKILNQEDTE